MANSLAPGEIYLIEEIDPRTQQPTDYCKIGIVRDKEGRSSDDRAKEHQTGNPRQLVVAEVVKTQVVETVETTLHRLYAPQRLSGEWFYMTEPERKAMIAVARQLAESASKLATETERANELSKMESSGSVLEATSDASATYKRLVACRFRLSVINELSSRLKIILAADIVEKGGKSKVGEVQQRKGREVFDEKAFQEKHPDLWDAFKKEVRTTSGRFILEKSTYDTVDADVAEMGIALGEIEGLGDSAERVARAQELNLRCRAAGAMSEWEQDVAETHLKVICGTAPGIAGVCKWKREEKVKTSLDKAALAAAHPSLVESFTSVTAGTEAIVIAKDTGFEH